MKVIPKHRRLVVGSRVFKVFEYKKPFNADTSDDSPILCALYSHVRFEFYIAGERSINIWNAKTGKPTRCLKNVFDKDITCMALDYGHRKLIVGSHNGEIKVFDLLSGVMISPLEPHKQDVGRGLESVAPPEVSFIGYGGKDNTIITTSWDRSIKVHKDDRDVQNSADDNVELADQKVLRCRKNCHQNDIICGDYAHNLQMIVTGSRDKVIRCWLYEKFKPHFRLAAHEDEVTMVHFLKPLPLLLTADAKGILYIWRVPRAKDHDPPVCLLKWSNKHSMEADVPISAVDSYYVGEDHPNGP